MRFSRSFFFALLMASAIPALAADKDSSPLQPAIAAEKQAVLTRGPYARQFLARAGLLPTEEEPRIDLGHPVVPGSTLLLPRTTVLNPRAGKLFADGRQPQPASVENLRGQALLPAQPAGQLVVIPYSDNVCYTMRMYKVKRTERLASGESASRGFSTCELARNFQIRSAVAHEQTGEARKAQSQ